MVLKKPVPDDRTIVPGVWEDILDDWSASFETSNRGTTGLGVFIQDQTTEPLDVALLQDRGSFTLASDTVLSSRFFDANAGHGIAVGEVIELANSITFMQARVLAVVTNAIEIDTPINHVYTSGDTAIRSSEDLRVNGSVTPQIFSILPLAGQSGDITRIIIAIESAMAMDFTKFGSLASLTNGCMLRVKRKGGDFRNLFNFKNNGDFIEKAFDHHFQDKIGGGGFGFVARLTYAGQSKHGVTIRLDGSLGEELQLVIQDDLSAGLTKFRVTAQGHELQE